MVLLSSMTITLTSRNLLKSANHVPFPSTGAILAPYHTLRFSKFHKQ
jgi:hypothetical protein